MKGRKVERLPDDIRSHLYSLLESKKLTCQEIADQVNDMLLEYENDSEIESIDDNTVWREAKRMERITEQMNESQRWAEAMADKYDLSQLGEQGRILLSMLQSAAFKTASHLMGKSDPIDPETLGDLVLSIQRLQRGTNYSAVLKEQIREEIKQEALAAAASVAEKHAKKGGVGKDAILQLRQAISDIKL